MDIETAVFFDALCFYKIRYSNIIKNVLFYIMNYNLCRVTHCVLHKNEDYTREELASSWYSGEEIKDLRESFKAIIARMSIGDDNDCTRGL